MSERWKPIPGFEGSYEVSDLGNVRSMARTIKGRAWPTKVMAKRINADGYPVISLRKGLGKKPIQCRIHRLILEAFVGPCPPGMEACHNDGTRANSTLANLRWDTREANHAEKKTTGTQKLSADQARQIRELCRLSSKSHREIARQFGISQPAVTRIATGKAWVGV